MAKFPNNQRTKKSDAHMGKACGDLCPLDKLGRIKCYRKQGHKGEHKANDGGLLLSWGCV